MTALGDLSGRCDPDLIRRGRQFERFYQWFMNHPVYLRKLRHVWLWHEWLGPAGASVSKKTWSAAAAAVLHEATARHCAGSSLLRRGGLTLIIDQPTAFIRQTAISVGSRRVRRPRRRESDLVSELSDAGEAAGDDARRGQVIASRSDVRPPVLDTALAQKAPDAAPASWLGCTRRRLSFDPRGWRNAGESRGLLPSSTDGFS